MKPFLPHLKEWLQKHDYPFEFTTEASINLADDDELLRLMRDANFFAVFVGIESPDEETLTQMRKKQNTRRDIAESVHKIYAHGMFVTAGFIVGFDAEKGSVARPMTDLLQNCSSRSPWWACSTRSVTRSSAAASTEAGRIHPGSDTQHASGGGDHCTTGLNFDTLRPRNDILTDYATFWRRCTTPEALSSGWPAGVMMDRSERRDALARRQPQGPCVEVLQVIDACRKCGTV